MTPVRPRTVVIVQARMESTRLPGKVLERFGGRTALSHVLRRCAHISKADAVCCAVSDTGPSDAVAEEAERAGAIVVRGSADDVLARYAKAARALQAEVVLRVTSDCPVIDPAVCDQVLALLDAENADFACNNMPPSWPHGLDCEAFRVAWLLRAEREAAAPEEREHVTPFIRNHADARKTNLTAPPGASMAQLRWTLDTPDDLAFFRALFSELPDDAAHFSFETPLKIVTDAPHIGALNASHERAPQVGAEGDAARTQRGHP